jgi:hypothetical protein
MSTASMLGGCCAGLYSRFERVARPCHGQQSALKSLVPNMGIGVGYWPAWRNSRRNIVVKTVPRKQVSGRYRSRFRVRSTRTNSRSQLPKVSSVACSKIDRYHILYARFYTFQIGASLHAVFPERGKGLRAVLRQFTGEDFFPLHPHRSPQRFNHEAVVW